MYSEHSICIFGPLLFEYFWGFNIQTHIELFMDGGEIGKEMLISLDNIIHGI